MSGDCSDRPDNIPDDAVPVQVTVWIHESDGYHNRYVDVTRTDGVVMHRIRCEKFSDCWGVPLPDPPFVDPLDLGYTRADVAALIRDRDKVDSDAERRLGNWYAAELGRDFR